MKKLSTVSLFIFGVVLIYILTAGLVFYQNKQNSQSSVVSSANLIKNTITKINPSGGSLILSIEELSKHNNQNDCWLLINGKIYDITSFFGSHPGGDRAMALTCGTDATLAYDKKDPNATNTTKGRGHSSNAQNMLNDYYLGDLNQIIK